MHSHPPVVKRIFPPCEGPGYPIETRAYPEQSGGIWAYTDCGALVNLRQKCVTTVSGSKIVEYEVMSTFTLIDGSGLFLPAWINGVQVECSWTDNLRINRWSKKVAHLPIYQRALIIKLMPPSGPLNVCSLVAVDDLVRRGR
jgi:hypothetical protein